MFQGLRRGALFGIPLAVGIVLFGTLPTAYGFLDAIDALEAEWTGETPDPMAPMQELLTQLDKIIVPDFDDVPPDAWFAPYARALARWKIVDGYRDAEGHRTRLFGPGDPVTVAQAVKMALRTTKVDEKTCGGTVTLPQANNHWAQPFILCAENRQFRLFQKGDTTDIDRPATRAEVLGIMHDAFLEPVPPLAGPFPDSVGHPYEADIAYASIRGVVSGNPDPKGASPNLFRPDDPVTRAETAKILYEQLRVFILSRDSAPSVSLDVTVKDHVFIPNTLTVRKGQFVTIRFHTTGKHTFTLAGLEINKLLANETEVVSFVPEKTGEFPFYCAVTGHKEKGMVGKLIVK